MPLPIIAIIGRPNVGKSTLFNRLLKRRMAVVDDKPGVTRDRNYAFTTWNRKEFYLVDTGGFVPESRIEMERLVKAQAEIAISEADLVLFLVDVKVGAQNIDLEIANRLRKMEKKVLLVANKVDHQKDEADVHPLNKLGLGEPMPVSGLNGRNIGELLDLISQSLLEESVREEIKESIRVAVIGRPNVGKSSFVNALLGQEKLIVAETPGTTRDSIDTEIEIHNQNYTLIDTAGLRRKSKIKNGIEYYTSLRTLRSIQRCDVALVLIEAQVGLVNQDVKIIAEVNDLKKGMVIGVNKWDLIEKNGTTADYYTKRIRREMPFVDHVPLIYVSAKTKQRVGASLNLISQVYNERKKRIDTRELNEELGKDIKRKPPAAVKGKYIKIYYFTQTDIEPPTFVFFSNYPELLQKSYLRYLENRIREHFGFMGTPIRIKIKKRQ
ncbi:MAG: GTP-binding protein Der [candidate division Zixibacteria bacterium SM1_73]|nr:MAG: GTP-binding protein Der [candidate division Zixibacteria bacterium SM1_73]